MFVSIRTVLFGRYLIVRYLGIPAIQNINQILPKKKPASRASVWNAAKENKLGVNK
jgi:hypothetical protein